MTTTTVPLPMPTPEPGPARGFPGIPCLYCDEDSCITLDLADLTGDEACHCNQCDTDFGIADVQFKLAAWAHVLAWVALAPEVSDS